MSYDRWKDQDDFKSREPERSPLGPKVIGDLSEKEKTRLKNQIIDHIAHLEKWSYPAPKAIDIAWWYGNNKKGLFTIPHISMSEYLFAMKELEYNKVDGSYTVRVVNDG